MRHPAPGETPRFELELEPSFHHGYLVRIRANGSPVQPFTPWSVKRCASIETAAALLADLLREWEEARSGG